MPRAVRNCVSVRSGLQKPRWREPVKRLKWGWGEFSAFVPGEQAHMASKNQAWVEPIDMLGKSWMLKKITVIYCLKQASLCGLLDAPTTAVATALLGLPCSEYRGNVSRFLALER